MTKPKREAWTITFVPAPDENNIPMPVRVRRLLKMALRSCRLRCIDYSSTTPQDNAHDSPEAKDDTNPKPGKERP